MAKGLFAPSSATDLFPVMTVATTGAAAIQVTERRNMRSFSSFSCVELPLLLPPSLLPANCRRGKNYLVDPSRTNKATCELQNEEEFCKGFLTPAQEENSEVCTFEAGTCKAAARRKHHQGENRVIWIHPAHGAAVRVLKVCPVALGSWWPEESPEPHSSGSSRLLWVSTFQRCGALEAARILQSSARLLSRRGRRIRYHFCGTTAARQS